MTVARAYDMLYTFSLIVLCALMCCCFVRSVRGPSVADRLMAVNMIGTMTIITIAVLAAMLEETYLADVGMIYALISFLAVVVITKVYSGVYVESHAPEKEKGDA